MALGRWPSISTVSSVPGLIKSRNGKPKAIGPPAWGEETALEIQPTSRSPLNSLLPAGDREVCEAKGVSGSTLDCLLRTQD